VKRGIIGSVDDFADSPLESVNYVECHDNYTLWDHMQFYIRQRKDEIKFTDADCERIHRLTAAILFTSQGIPMMQMGQEMCRTKFGDENSYESPDSVNMIRWESKRARPATVSYYRGLIALRRQHPELFCMTDATVVRSHVTFYEDLGLVVPSRCIAYRIMPYFGNGEEAVAPEIQPARSATDGQAHPDEQWQAVVVLLNPNPTDVEFALPEADRFQHWVPVVNATFAGTEDLGSPEFSKMLVAGRSAAVVRRATPAENSARLLEMRLDRISDAFCTPVEERPSLYAVGISRERTPEEQAAHELLVRRRVEFLNGRSAM
jgi:pullulanase